MSTMLGPTPERVAKAVDLDVPIVDEKRRRAAFRILDVVEVMRRAERLRDEQVAAFRKFEKDYTTALSSSVLLCRYGDRAGGSGTPLSQLANDLLCPEERRADAHKRVADAALAVGEPRTVETLLLIVTAETSLEEIGRVVLMIGNRPQAKAAAERTVQMGTFSLARHYGYIDPNPGCG